MGENKSYWPSTLLLIFTVAAVIAAVLGLRNLLRFPVHDDGVTWVERELPAGARAVTAGQIQPGGPGDRAAIRTGDQVTQIRNFKITSALDVARALWSTSLSEPVRYLLRRDGIDFQKDNIFLQPLPRDPALFYQYAIAFAYLGLGLFVQYRRTGAAKSLHFYLLCLTSFIAYGFHYSGRLNTFDELMYWGNVSCHLLAPAIFLHFCLDFRPQRGQTLSSKVAALLYLPSVIIFLVFFSAAQGILHVPTPVQLRWLLDRIATGYSVLLYLAGAWALHAQFRRAEDPVARRQLKYLRNGALVGTVPFAVLYAIPFALGATPSHILSLSILSTGLIPLAWAYAITRYRLMDVDIIFQQGYVYTLATLAVIGSFYGLMFLVFDTQSIPPPAFVVLISFATFIFQPIRRWMQEQMDRWIFYRDRYDARQTLVAFARELSSETDVDVTLAKVSDRLKRTLSIQRVGFFLREGESDSFQLRSLSAHDPRTLDGAIGFVSDLDLSFLPQPGTDPYLFFERPKHLHDIISKTWPERVRSTLARLDFTYYIACRYRGRTTAYFGVSRTTEGDFLSSDDIELLITLSNYVAIALENARLYASLQSKVDEYERLKDFSENIVESINVGVLAVSLEDRVESWNSQVEKLTGIPRLAALGASLSTLLPPDLMAKFSEARRRDDIFHLYKFSLRPLTNSTDGAESRQESIVNVAVAPLFSKQGSLIGRLMILDDITDRDDLERRLVQADKLSSIGLMAAGVAHEVNTPLAVISTYAQMLHKQLAGDDPKAKMLDKIAKQTFRASEIVNSLLNFSRTSPTEFQELDLNRIVRETISLVDHQFVKVGIRTQCVLSEQLPALRGNPGKLQQVLLNLVLNARDAMPQGGSLILRTLAVGGGRSVVVEIEDQGEGMSSDVVSKIFDPFFTTKGARKGTGLGLSITYGIVQEHNGTIEVESVPGKGTRFHLEFPASRPSGSPATPVADAEPREAMPA